mmetsp:Transcript_9085/g.11092  ORF Transcript_9085/g.11092 Transcript_9085/m.11092 type:complete len:211 (-) Transcript_9085:5282-5914(-)
MSQCASCPTGYYCTQGVYDRSKQCAAGYYCLTGAKKKNEADNICPSGFFCLQGTKLPTACEEGKYSLPGGKTADDCVDCIEGYYCVIGVSTTYLNKCPTGHYCPAGENMPRACPKGFYNRKEKSTSLKDCIPCPKGTLCDVTGISNYEDHYCPPGFYCLEGTYQKKPCPPGTFRPSKGASSIGPLSYANRYSGEAACYSCPAGFYCPDEG